MIEVIVLDSGPLGLVSNPKPNPLNLQCNAWLDDRLSDGCRVLIPAIVDYEIRRELIRAEKTAGLRRLDAFCEALEFVSLTDSALRRAATIWAEARSLGRPSAGDRTLDADVILAAQTLELGESDVVIATTNIGHLGRYARADLWQNIR